MVTFLSKFAECEGFEQIMDFMNANPISYALTINPTIYISCIEQSWSTVKAKIVIGKVQLQALVDGKKIIIIESTVRRDLQLEDAEGVDCLPNATIFEQLALMGYEQSSGPTNHVADEAIYKELDDSLVRAATTASSLEAEQDNITTRNFPISNFAISVQYLKFYEFCVIFTFNREVILWLPENHYRKHSGFLYIVVFRQSSHFYVSR
ncbi:hypothetical protein Tco_0070519 [Tanacetum coccineum]